MSTSGIPFLPPNASSVATEVDLLYLFLKGVTAFFVVLVAFLGIACTKATLVIWFFMGVRYNTPLTKVVVVSGFAWLLILFGGHERLPQPALDWSTGKVNIINEAMGQWGNEAVGQ